MTKLIRIFTATILILLAAFWCAQAFDFFSFGHFTWGQRKNTVTYEDLTVSATFSPLSSFTFANTTTGKNRVSSFRVTNGGNDTLQNYSTTASGTGFSKYSSPSGNITAGSYADVKFRFAPSSAGAATGSIVWTAPNMTSKTFHLHGTGVCEAQTITWNSQPAAMTVGDADQTLNMASASSGLSVAYTTSTTDYCTVVAGALHAVAAGTCVVHANQAGNGTYCAASQVDSGDVTISAGGPNCSSGTTQFTSLASTDSAQTVNNVNAGGSSFKVTANSYLKSIVVYIDGSDQNDTLTMRWGTSKDLTTYTGQATASVTNLGAQTVTFTFDDATHQMTTGTSYYWAIIRGGTAGSVTLARQNSDMYADGSDLYPNSGWNTDSTSLPTYDMRFSVNVCN